MAYQFNNRVRETTTTTGTGTIALAGAVTGFRAFSAICANNDTVYYCIEDLIGGGWEVGLGTWQTGNNLARTAGNVLDGSSGVGTLVSFAAGTKNVFLTVPASQLPDIEPDGGADFPDLSAPATLPSVSTGFGTTLFNTKRANRGMMGDNGSLSGVWARSFASAMWQRSVTLYLPNNGATLGLNYGTVWAGVGTISHPTPAATNRATQMYRTRFANIVTTTNQVLGITSMLAGNQRYQCNTGAGLGGFFMAARFTIELWPANTVRLFVGFHGGTTAITASDTIPAVDVCGFWHDTADGANVLNFLTKTAAGSSTKNALTGTAPTLAAGQAFDAFIFCPPGGTTIYWELWSINAGTQLCSGSTTTTLPTSAGMMGSEVAMSNGTANTTVTTVAPGIGLVYIEDGF